MFNYRFNAEQSMTVGPSTVQTLVQPRGLVDRAHEPWSVCCATDRGTVQWVPNAREMFSLSSFSFLDLNSEVKLRKTHPPLL